MPTFATRLVASGFKPLTTYLLLLLTFLQNLVFYLFLRFKFDSSHFLGFDGPQAYPRPSRASWGILGPSTGHSRRRSYPDFLLPSFQLAVVAIYNTLRAGFPKMKPSS